MFEGEFDGMPVEGLHRFDDVVVGGIERLFLGVDDSLIVPPHSLGVEVGAIVEFHPLAQMEHIDLAVLEDLPGFGEVGDKIQLGINSDQAIEEIPHHQPRLHAKGEMGIQAGDIGFPRHPQCAAWLGLLRPAYWQP
jgi:hypothetical protein